MPTRGWGSTHLVLPNAAATLRALENVSKDNRGPTRPGVGWDGGFERLTLRGVYTGDGTPKRLGREVTCNQPNSCTSFVLTFESPQCPAFIPGSGDLPATG